jgi:cell fate regulator YaaT (PSP1 superfamily)
MAFAIGIKFDPDQFARFFKAPDDLKVEENDFCIVRDRERGLPQIGYVSCFEGRCPSQIERLPVVERRASNDEISQWHDNCRRSRQALSLVRAKVQEHGLPMKINSVIFDDAQNEVVFHFSADRRIDFRELVRDLAGQLKARIELWQIGSRRAASEQDGFGHCGQRLCCASWMKGFPAVSIRHVREQDIAQAPPKLSGFCGRLRCCLRFEHDTYCELRKDAPSVGAKVRESAQTQGSGAGREREQPGDDPQTLGVVLERNLLRGEAYVQFGEEKPRWVAFNHLTVIVPGSDKTAGAHRILDEDDEDVVVLEETEDDG